MEKNLKINFTRLLKEYTSDVIWFPSIMLHIIIIASINGCLINGMYCTYYRTYVCIPLDEKRTGSVWRNTGSNFFLLGSKQAAPAFPVLGTQHLLSV